MLKRARCTVYMVQESDTMGKDSELASTLAQGKPVIAYVPHIDPRKHAKLLRDYPLDYFLFRFLTLTTDGTFEDDKFVQAAAKKYPEGPKFITAFFKAVAEYRRSQPFTLWDERENKFKAEVEHFDDICSILAIAEMVSADKRADVLREAHPLSLQVHLETGVLNGVLVVRSEEQTARLLAAMLTNKLNFTFHDDSENKCILLKEEISQSPFRVVTKNEKISNSFWNFYLAKEHYES